MSPFWRSRYGHLEIGGNSTVVRSEAPNTIGSRNAAQTVVNTVFDGKKVKIVTENFSYAKQ